VAGVSSGWALAAFLLSADARMAFGDFLDLVG